MDTGDGAQVNIFLPYDPAMGSKGNVKVRFIVAVWRGHRQGARLHAGAASC